MVWDGVGWCGMVWDGVGWCRMVWDGVGWCGMVWGCRIKSNRKWKVFSGKKRK